MTLSKFAPQKFQNSKLTPQKYQQHKDTLLQTNQPLFVPIVEPINLHSLPPSISRGQSHPTSFISVKSPAQMSPKLSNKTASINVQKLGLINKNKIASGTRLRKISALLIG